MTWREISRDNLTAAKSLLSDARWRSSVSRAYYAAFAALSGALQRVVSLPADRDAPAHSSMPLLIKNYLSRLHVLDRRTLMSDVRKLYDLRISADYRVTRTIDRATSLLAVKLATRVIEMLDQTNA